MTPLFLKDVALTIDGDDFKAEVSSVTFTPSSSITTWKGLTPAAVHTNTSSATWTADLTFAQDWDDVDSLSRYLFENEGEADPMVFTPKSGGQGFTATVVITPGAVGGSVDSFAEATVSLGVQGKPAIIPTP